MCNSSAKQIATLICIHIIEEFGFSVGEPIQEEHTDSVLICKYISFNAPKHVVGFHKHEAHYMQNPKHFTILY